METLLKVESLQKHFSMKGNAIFGGNKGVVKAVDGISFEIEQEKPLV